MAGYLSTSTKLISNRSIKEFIYHRYYIVLTCNDVPIYILTS